MGNRRGFTLIELLIVVVIIGILAAVAIPKFANTKGRAYVASMKSDLRNLATAQESYLYDNSIYYTGSIPSAAFDYRASDAVSVTVVIADVGGWAATATHTGTPETCALFVGSAAAPSPATVEGQVTCS